MPSYSSLVKKLSKRVDFQVRMLPFSLMAVIVASSPGGPINPASRSYIRWLSSVFANSPELKEIENTFSPMRMQYRVYLRGFTAYYMYWTEHSIKDLLYQWVLMMIVQPINLSLRDNEQFHVTSVRYGLFILTAGAFCIVHIPLNTWEFTAVGTWPIIDAQWLLNVPTIEQEVNSSQQDFKIRSAITYETLWECRPSTYFPSVQVGWLSWIKVNKFSLMKDIGITSIRWKDCHPTYEKDCMSGFSDY